MSFLFFLCIPFLAMAAEAVVIDHTTLPEFGKAGAMLKGLATPQLGAKQYEVWHSTLAPGGCTPIHTHETEEIAIYIKGKGKAIVGGKEIFFEAPCTVIYPADVEHQVFNTGDEPSDHILILGIDSTIVDQDQVVMHLPWRK
ncbi:MAG: cupin domain-containing protein [Chlamydiia bacterium]|nr:cupin domain-containing protein [Chlamydiia bacterium]MCP5505440.1 cupin domain-containing protein [Chlamydiales bacterium]